MITNRTQLLRATDEEIEQFFSKTTFEGIFSLEIKSKNTEFYKGSISDIKMSGRPTNLVLTFLNVPKSSNVITEGPCSFKCRINISALKENPPRYSVNLLGSSLRSIEMISEAEKVSSKDAKEEDLFAMWGVDSCECIGYYHYDEENDAYFVDDLRKTNFDHIPYYPGDEDKRPIRIFYPNEIKGIKLNDYYLFTWKLSHRNSYNPYEIFIDFKTQPRPVEPKWFIDTLFDDRHNDKSKNFGSATNFLDTLSKQLSAKESTFIYELLQNANDYPFRNNGVDVEFHITENYLLLLHSGDKFNVRNISGICGINEKEKVANRKTIGYKGIGFKTVFLNNHYVYLRTGEYSFRFEEKAKKIRRLEAPWPILPLWTELNEVPEEVNKIFDKANNKYRVKIALKPDNKNLLHVGRNSYENLFREIFADSNIILFIPNLSSVKVIINGVEERFCKRNNDEWIINDYVEEIPDELQYGINKTIETGRSRIPEKYKDFTDTRVSFACKHEGGNIKPVEDATLYCYLPTKTSWSLPFLMNTDMIPKGDRNDIETEVRLIDEEETNFNEELTAIAGAQLYFWLYDLLISKKYHYGSIYSLVPDFRNCITQHKEYLSYIERFQESFENMIASNPIVPVHKDIAKISDTIFDKTGLTTCGIITDDEFYLCAGYEDSRLPIEMLRNDKKFITFQKRYIDEENIFDKSSLHKMVRNEKFKEWLKSQENNNKFLNFLLDNDLLNEFLDEKILIEDECGDLFSAEELYYDIDDELTDLSAFSKQLYYLSLKTREYFKNNKNWLETTSGAFNEFNASTFICDTLLSEDWDDTVEALKNWDVSFHFYRFLAKNGIVPEELNDLPFFNDEEDSEVVKDFNDKFVFFSSREAKEICNSPWLSSVTFVFISPHYDKVTLQFFEENLIVRKFTDKIIINEVVISDDYQKEINEAQQESDEISLAFVSYCYSHKNLLENGALFNYALFTFDGDGDGQCCLAEDHIYFQSNLYDSYSSKEWLNYDWMYVLNEVYFERVSNIADYKKFLSDKFCVEELTEKILYNDVVKKNIKSIIENTSGENDNDGQKNIDFVKYLDKNYQLIFEEKRDERLFAEFVPVSTEVSDLSLKNRIYLYNEELADLIRNSWFPQDIVCLCNKEYGKSPALLAIGCQSYEFGKFYDDVIIGKLDTINDNINSKEASISFHSFVIGHLGSLTIDQQSKMVGAKVFLYGGDNASGTSSGHKILSSKARELFEKGLVEFSDLDIIDPDYKPEDNSEYWETRLGNTKFTVAHFFSWLKDNSSVFTEILQEKNLNIEFWRWLKDNATDKHIEDIPTFPIILKDGSTDNSSETIYFSDEYMGGTNIESFVRRFDKDALFLTPEYINEEDNIEEWKTFWTKVGVKYEIVDILVEAIIPKLEDIDDEGLVKLIADNRTTLEKSYEEGLIPQLTNLRVKALDGEFYNINEAIYIDCEKDEPFPYIKLPNQISFNTAEERRLIKDIIDEVGEDCVSTLSEWQQCKLDRYLAMQTDDCDSVREFHYKFINDLSIIRNAKRESLKEIERIEDIYLLNRNDDFCKSSTLTMGSIYKPFFDFEVCGINSLDYINNSYSSKCSEYPNRLFRALNVHCDFLEDDINFLTNRKCSLYFWGKYLTKKEVSTSRVKEIISNNLLDDLACIPTKDYMKTPAELYYGSEVSKYVKAIEDWENKIPLKDLPEIKLSDNSAIFGMLPFKESLDFLDALYALVTIASQERRSQLLKWMIEDDVESYYAKIQEYREDKHALWKNNKNENVHIQELYALDYWDKTLEQYFGTNPRIVNKAYFPAGDLFKVVCDMLGIETITSEYLEMEPVGDSIYSSQDNDLKLYALVMAGIIDNENWQSLYSGYCVKLSDLALHKCKHITISYIDDKSINQDLWKFYHKENSNDFYFVDSLDGKRVFSQFVNEYMKFLGITDVAKEVAEDIMDSRRNAIEFVKEQNALMLDNSFKEELKKLGVTDNLSGNEAEMDEEQDVGYTPSFTTVLNGDELEGSGAVGKEITDDVEDEESDSVFEEGEKVRVREHERNYPGTGDASNKTAINSVPTQGSMDKGDDVNLTPSINPQPPNILQDEFSQMESDENYDLEEEPEDEDNSLVNTTLLTENNDQHNSDRGYMGSVDKDEDYQPIGSKPYMPRTRRHPKPYTREEINRLRSNGTPLELESFPPTEDEINLLGQCGISPEEIADTNYLAQLRLYMNLRNELNEEPEESMGDFIRNADDVTTHALKGGRYIHTCSAARGIMYVSPSVWKKMIDDKWTVCVYLDGQGKNFHYINNADEFLKLVEKDDIVLKITGAEKVNVVNKLYNGILEGVKGTAYTLIRVAARTNMDAVYAHYVGSMAEAEDGNEDDNDY